MKEKNFVSAVVYLRNDEARVPALLRMLHGVLAANFLAYEIICVDDHSADGTVAAVKSAEPGEGGKLSVVRMSRHHGPEAAMNAGVDLAIGDFVLEFDSAAVDYDPGLVMEVYRKALTGFDIVSARPNGRTSVGSRLFYALFNRYASKQHSLGSESFRILSRRAINRVHAMSKTVPFRKAAYASCGLKMCAVQYKRTKRVRVAADGSKRYELAVNSLVLFTDVGYKLAKWLTLLMMLMTLGFAVYTVVVYFGASPVEGWTTTMLLASAGFFGMFAILTVVVKYLSILTGLVFMRQKYNIEGIEKLF